MLALIGRVLEKTLNSLIGENKTPWRKCGYNTFLAFSVKSAGTLVPPKGCSLGWDKRKTTLEAAWKALSAHQQEVFDARPCNHDKAKHVSRKGLEESTNAGPQALKHLIRINSEVNTTSHLQPTRYPGSGSFCKKLSNNPYWLLVAKDRWKAKETCKAYSHTREIQEVVNESRKNPPPAKKPKPSNETRSILQKKLNQLLGNTLGCDEQFFPKSANPASRLSERFPTSKYPNLKMVQSEESQLSDEMFALGLEAMETKFRKQWLANIEKGHFKITNTVQTSTTENNTTKTNTTQTNTTDP
ncbi:hypothetical protein MJO28_008653 [Puccinia striiformis f. sp. tritici]|uniref:Uncharacterized protein n=1 Tax=Puccinia striiformis f. sp. tritici TaxID=168172 RepID=A0ACC0EB72_9BASI|nr:hypothetical protein MJO28_008653 [Puccinia striiformis f. sp. tritici]